MYVSASLIMSKRMKDNLSYLQVLSKCKPKLRKALVEHGPVDLVICICECALNLLKGVIPLTLSQKRTLSRYKKHLRILADKKVSRKKKKHLLVQKGGNPFLASLLPPVLSVLGSLFTK